MFPRTPKMRCRGGRKVRNFLSPEFSSAHSQDLTLFIVENGEDRFLYNWWRDRGTSHGLPTK